MVARTVIQLVLTGLVAVNLAACGGEDIATAAPNLSGSGGGGGSTLGGTISGGTASNLPPPPFGLTTTAQFALTGWQESSTGPESAFSLAQDKAVFSWSSAQKTYTIDLLDQEDGNLVYAFPGNLAAFSVIRADGTQAKVNVTLYPAYGDNVGKVYWHTADDVAPRIYAEAIFGLPVQPGGIPASGARVFVTDNSPQSSIVVDFAKRQVTGSLTTSYNDTWGPYNVKDRATLDPAELSPDGTFVATIGVPDAPRQGKLYGRLFGAQGTSLGVYWDGPARGGYDDSGWTDWRAVMAYVACTSCTP